MTHLFDPPKPNQPVTPDVNHDNNHYLNNSDGNIHADNGTELTNSPTNEPPINSQSDSQSVLRNPNFLSLWSGQVFSQIADKVFLVLVIAIVSTQFQHKGETISGWVSAVMVSFTIPAILFGSIAGVYVDRWNKKNSFS